MLFEGLNDTRALLEALPVGISVYDEQRRLTFANAVLRHALGVTHSTYRPGSTFADHIRVAAHRGLFGPGDPDVQATENAALDFTQPRRFRRRLPDGRSFDAHYMPLPAGAMMVCVIDTTASAALREDAERIAARIQAALSGLRIGVAVFTPERTLALNNACFATLLGFPVTELVPGASFERLLRTIFDRGEFIGSDATPFLKEQLALDRSRPSGFRRARANGAVLDVSSDPLPDGGWSMTVSDISPLVRAEDEARRRAGQLDTMLRVLPYGVSVSGPDRRIAIVNEAYGRILGDAAGRVGEPEEATARRRALSGEYGPGDPEEHVQRYLAYDISVPQTWRRQRGNGNTIEVRTAPLPDGGHISVVGDLTDLVEAKAEAQRTAELMASIVNHIPHGVSVYGPDRRLRLVNVAYGRIMAGAPIAIGDTVDEVIARRVKAGEFGDGDPAAVTETQRNHARTIPMLRRRRRPNGTTIDIRTAQLPDGGHISVVTDVTQLVEAEAGLGRSAADMDAMLANIRHGIVLWSAEKRVAASNRVAEELVDAAPGHFAQGRTLEEMVASAHERGNLGHGRVADDRAAWLLQEDRSQSHLDQRLTRAGRILEVRSDPTPGGGFVTTYTDVTQIREAEDALRLAKTAAEAANAAKSRFLAAMSTELRSPIAAIQSELGTLTRAASDSRARHEAGVDPSMVQHSCHVAADAARRLLGLIDSILDVARLESGRFDLADDVVHIPQLIRDCLRKSDSAAAAAEVALVVDLPETLPLLRGDAGRLRQALGHLIANAIRFTPALGSISIGARQEWTTGDLLLTVTDTGDGIESAVLESVFEPFAQAPDGTRAGLGLYLSRTSMRAHDGDLVLRSTPGEGTVAVLRLPANRVVPEDAAPGPPAGQA